MPGSPAFGGSDSADRSEGIADAAEARLNPTDHALQRGATQNDDGAKSSASADVDGIQEAKERAILDGTHNTLGNPSQANQPTVSNQAQVNTRFLDAARDGDENGLVAALDEADPTATNEFSETALHLACRYGHVRIVEKLLNLELQKKNIEARDIDGWTPLLSTCSENHDDDDGTLKILKALLKHQPDINAKSSMKQTALHFACSYSSAAVAELLLKQEKIDATAQDENGNTPLNLACQECTTTEIEALWNLGSGANVGARIGVNIPNNRKSTPLTSACQFQSAKVVKSLLAIDADVEISDKDGDTPLILASRFGNVEMVRAILDRKPKNWDHKNEEGKNATDYAMSNTSAQEIIPLLLNRGLKLGDEDALEIFAGGTSRAVPATHLQDSAWLKLVRDMLTFHSPLDQPLLQTIEPIMKFASKEEKVWSILNTDTEQHFQILNTLTKDLGMSEEICKMIWRGRRDPEGALVSPGDLDLVKETLPSTEEWSNSKSELVPKTPLQWSAFYGEHQLVWCLLKEMQSRDNGDVGKALEIAKARKSARSTKGRKGTVPTDNEKENRMDSKQSGRAKDSKKSSVDKEIKRYEYTIDILNNATSLVSIAKKQLILADPIEIKGKEDVLQQSTATVVSFYERDGQIDILRSTTNILELIYANDDKRVNAVLDMARQTFDEMTKNRQSNEEPKEKPQMRWIHLPANHVSYE
ncbi:hypothetical protein PFICI_06873 [Pestalotiopsis fici W106-1]|uniref:Uncharacterized protein n=1 Tax=Pestalotiopsis fici (strain W106-1 / CGMCC3.15140) TaxID=1229662 RepID=W3X9M5_PESFW|nr:uncharacterized protein PFICI_06873 [Pestalotiopsis fici W106-1]ETS81871.1 hypothetical protein PFICI_06873 [Pestalotiopsis fici W106-1]